MKMTYEKNMRYPAVKASVAMKSSIFSKNVSLSFFLKLGPNIFQCNVVEITQLFVYFTFLLFIGFRTPIYASFSELNSSVLTEIRQIRVRFYFKTSL